MNRILMLFFMSGILASGAMGQSQHPSRDGDYYTGNPLRIGNDWQLLMDETLVEDRFRVERRLMKPVKNPSNPILVRDRPWEGDGISTPSVIWDPDLKKYRMWYRCFSASNYYGATGPPYYIAYAESEDGFNWHKPLMKVVDMPGFDSTNIVYTGTYYPRVQGPQVWLDETESDPERRYKMVVLERRPDADGKKQSGVQMAYSVDGLQWRLDNDEDPLLDYHSDCYNHIVRSPDDTHWLLYCRPILMKAGEPAQRKGMRNEDISGAYRRHAGRRVSVAVSEDLKNWTFPRTVLYPDERDMPDIDRSLVFLAGSGLVMLYTAMDGEKTGKNEVKLASSAEGFYWHRFHDRSPYIKRGPSGAWDSGNVSTGGTPVSHGEFTLIYYNGGTHGQHEDGHSARAIGLALIKKNRFVEQYAGDTPGYLLTKEFVLEGNRLVVNTTGALMPNRPEAELRVEILRKPSASGEDRTVIDGFTLEDCDVIRGDRTEVTVSWNGKSDLSALEGQPVYLRFQLRNKGLCAFKIDQK